MTALKEEAVKIIENMKDDDMAQVVAYLKKFALLKAEQKDREKAMKGIETLLSFAGTLPQDFDYEKELAEAREGKYGSFD